MSLFTQYTDSEILDRFTIDTLTLRDGSKIDMIFFAHASLAISSEHSVIYIDPMMEHAPYARLPKATVIAITHAHYDHLDLSAIDILCSKDSRIIADNDSAKQIGGYGVCAVKPREVVEIADVCSIEAVAAYNISEGHLGFHPKEREDCGYVISIGGSRIYIAGDTEPTPEMLELRDIDIAMLPVNQPYTMSEEQAIESVKSLRPAIFYPYHYGMTEHKTDLDKICRAIEGSGIEMRIRPMA